LAILEQRSTLTRFGCRDIDGRKLFEGRELGQLESVVAVGLALHVLPLPSFAAGIGDLTLHAALAAQIVHPTSDRAGLDDYQIGTFSLQQSIQLQNVCHDRGKPGLARCGDIIAGDGLILAEVDGEDLHDHVLLCVRKEHSHLIALRALKGHTAYMDSF
jgi:hypothetical protein